MTKNYYELITSFDFNSLYNKAETDFKGTTFYYSFNLMMYGEKENFDWTALGMIVTVTALEITEAGIMQTSGVSSLLVVTAAPVIAGLKQYIYQSLGHFHFKKNIFVNIIEDFKKTDKNIESGNNYSSALANGEALAIQSISILVGVLGSSVKFITALQKGNLYTASYSLIACTIISVISYNFATPYNEAKSSFDQLRLLVSSKDNVPDAYIPKALNLVNELKEKEKIMFSYKLPLIIIEGFNEIMIKNGGLYLIGFIKSDDVMRATSDATFIVEWSSLNSYRFVDLYQKAKLTQTKHLALKQHKAESKVSADSNGISLNPKFFKECNHSKFSNNMVDNIYKTIFFTPDDDFDNQASYALGTALGITVGDTLLKHFYKTNKFVAGFSVVAFASSKILYTYLANFHFSSNAQANIIKNYEITYSIYQNETSNNEEVKKINSDLINQSDCTTYQITPILQGVIGGGVQMILGANLKHIWVMPYMAVLSSFYYFVIRDAQPYLEQSKKIPQAIRNLAFIKNLDNEKFSSEISDLMKKQADADNEIVIRFALMEGMKSFHNIFIKQGNWQKIFGGDQNEQEAKQYKSIVSAATYFVDWLGSNNLKVLDFYTRAGLMNEGLIKSTNCSVVEAGNNSAFDSHSEL